MLDAKEAEQARKEARAAYDSLAAELLTAHKVITEHYEDSDRLHEYLTPYAHIINIDTFEAARRKSTVALTAVREAAERLKVFGDDFGD